MPLLEWIGAWPGAVLLRGSGTAWLLVNAAHILGIAMLIGAILPFDLRLLGLFRAVPLAVLAPVLLRAAATGAVVAILTGLWLFSMKPREYLANGPFLLKAGLLALAFSNVGLQHANRLYARAIAGAELRPTVRLAAAASILLWLAVLVAGRWIAFV
jgi:hypothetical protein